MTHCQHIVLAMVASLVLFQQTEAITKKSDDTSGLSNGNQPVYQPNSNMMPYSVPSQYSQNQEAPPSQQSNNIQQGGSPQSNMYYYYYPMQDKPQKEANFHSSPSSPVNHRQSSSVQDHSSDHGPMDAAASGSEISYSTPEINQEYNPQSQGFDAQTLSNLASQLQGYGFNGAASNYDSNLPSMNYGSHAEASNHMPSHGHPVYNGPMNSPSHLGFGQNSPYPDQHSFGPFNSIAQAAPPQASEVSSITSGLKKYGLTSILMPVLAIAGLSLLLPTVTSLGTTTTKTKRSIEEPSPIASYIEKMDNYYKMYNKAMEKEDCMNRMICELGDAVSEVRGRSALLMVVENIAPQWMEKKMTVFKNGALSKDTTKCKKYTC